MARDLQWFANVHGLSIKNMVEKPCGCEGEMVQLVDMWVRPEGEEPRYVNVLFCHRHVQWWIEK